MHSMPRQRGGLRQNTKRTAMRLEFQLGYDFH
jgi:hypothetical protein